jgi:hypothetical protein
LVGGGGGGGLGGRNLHCRRGPYLASSHHLPYNRDNSSSSSMSLSRFRYFFLLHRFHILYLSSNCKLYVLILREPTSRVLSCTSQPFLILRTTHSLFRSAFALTSLILTASMSPPTAIHEAGRCATGGVCKPGGFFSGGLPCAANEPATTPGDATRKKLVDICGS